MVPTLKARAILHLAHDIDRPARREPRPIPLRLAVVLFACFIVPVLILFAELVRELVKGWMA